MTKVPGSVQINSIMYRGSNSESAAASSFFPDSVSPIFLFPVWRKMAVGGRFSAKIRCQRPMVADMESTFHFQIRLLHAA